MSDGVADVDEGYADPVLASLYDAECPWHPQDDFYLALDLAADSVLDVGCGTGTRLTRTREVGHAGRLVGVDPAPGMLAMARAKTDRVDWVYGDAQTLDLGERFGLLTMTGHAFQVLLDDDAVRAALRAFHRHLRTDGLLAFETRNPAARAWETWLAAQSRGRIEGPDGASYDVCVDLRATAGDLVTFDAVTRSVRDGWERTSTSTLRFLDQGRLGRLLTEAGFVVEDWFGDWDRRPVAPAHPELIVLARPAG